MDWCSEVNRTGLAICVQIKTITALFVNISILLTTLIIIFDVKQGRRFRRVMWIFLFIWHWLNIRSTTNHKFDSTFYIWYLKRQFLHTMGDNFRVITSDFVRVNVTNSQNSALSLEQKFAKSLTIEELKVWIYNEWVIASCRLIL